MEEEIDLREYILVLLKHWKWIAGVTLVAAVVALVVSFLLPPTYEATALLAVTRPRYVMQFDPRIAPVESVSSAVIQPPYKAYPELASSDEVLQELLAQLNPRLEKVETVEDLRELIKAKSGTDQSLVILTVRWKDPEKAAEVANLWAEILVRRANEIYGSAGESQFQFYQQQLQRAEEELRTAEEALVAFQARNQESILEHQLGSRRQMHADYLAAQREIAYIIQDIRGLREQLSRQPADQSVGLSDQLTVLFLEIKAFNAHASQSGELLTLRDREFLEIKAFNAHASAPIQLQVDSAATLSDKSLAEQIAFLDELVRVLEEKSAEIEGQISALEPEILALQQQLQEVYTENDRLTRARDVARETYITLARKVEEQRIAAEDNTGDVRIASRAAAPEEPASPRKLLNTAVAGVLGLMLSVFGVFMAEWWRAGVESASAVGASARATAGRPEEMDEPPRG